MSEFVHTTLARTEQFVGAIFTVVTDNVTMSGGNTAKRDLVRTKGAVAVVALDEAGKVVLIRQYRHAVGQRLWELPAGLLDQPGEEPAAAAARELFEEADLTAGRYDLLLDLHTSPGFSDETIRIFLARELSVVAEAQRYHRSDEEADLTITRFDLDEAVAMVTRGEITNAAAVSGLLTAAHARNLGWSTLR